MTQAQANILIKQNTTIIGLLARIECNTSEVQMVDAKNAIRMLGRSNVRDMKYIREHFLRADDYRMKNGKEFEYSKRVIMELRRKIEAQEIILPFSTKLKAA